MTRSVCTFVLLSLLSFSAKADDGFPVGVIVYDAAPLTQSRASTRSSFVQPIASQPATPEAVTDSTTVEPLINLAPGETVLQVITAPSAIVQIPNPEPVYTLKSGPALASPTRRAVREPVVDPFSGRLRDTAGWTGSTEGPASIGCFPEGACAILNRR